MKKKYLALLLSAAMAFSNLPAISTNAAPASKELTAETGETITEESETVSAEEPTEPMNSLTEDETATTEETETEEFSEQETASETEAAEDVSVEEISDMENTEEATAIEETLETVFSTEEGLSIDSSEVGISTQSVSIKAVGSNGIQYNNVAYLSSASVQKLPAATQNVYTTMCDEIASWKESGLEVYDIVISVNKNGDLEMGASIPAQAILTEDSTTELIEPENEALAQSYDIAGEDVTGIPFVELNTLLENEKYFRDQLDSDFEKLLFDTGKTSIVTNGNNYIELKDISSEYLSWVEPCNVFSALITTYPNQFNWVNWGTGGFRRTITYYESCKTYTYKYSLDKSNYYSSSLEKQADAKVKTLVAEANAYAEDNYQESPAYGIIEYFNEWICENNFYEKEHGTSTEKSVKAGKIYYYSHSCYGTLLYGYGVCESYALTMSRLLDGAGIRNIYVTGYANGDGHAWNYVQMPDSNWYLVDSTWNDSLNTNSYLLSQGINSHEESGARWPDTSSYDFLDFEYPDLAPEDYTPGISEAEQTAALTISNETVVLKPGQKFHLSLDDPNTTTGNYYEKFVKTWSSSNTKIAKVDSFGKVTAGTTPGQATITVKAAGKEFTSTVYVYQFTNIRFDTNNKASYTGSYANPDTFFDEDDLQTVELTVNQKNPQITAAAVVSGNNLNEVTAVSNKPHIAKVESVTLEDDTITLNVLPKAVGSAKITISLAGKKAYYTINITQDLQDEWFDYSKIITTEYTGKAIKYSIPLTEQGRDCSPRATYKITYTNNKNAGEATITIKGTGKYSGTIIKNFTILPKDMSTAVFRSCTSSRIYNAKARAASTVVRLGQTTLKAGRDYTVFYNGSDTVPTQTGEYTITIEGKGNYTGSLSVSKIYTIKPNSIKNMAVSYRSSMKYTGEALSPLKNVRISGNLLPEENYTVSYFDNTGVEITEPVEKGKYTLVISPTGENITTTLTKTCIKKTFTIK